MSALSECSLLKLAEAFKDKYPLLAEFLVNSRFVDDLGDSADKLELIRQADSLFEEVGLGCKGWSFSGFSPPAEVVRKERLC